MKSVLIISSLLTFALNDFLLSKVQAQDGLKLNITPKGKTESVTWKTTSKKDKHDEAQTDWEDIPITEGQNQPSSIIIWEVLNPDKSILIPPSKEESNPRLIRPINLEEVEALLNNIPLQPSDFKPLNNLSHATPTASVLGQEEWLFSQAISSFKYKDGTGNQNYALQIDYGISDTFQISGFYSESDDPINARITGFDIRPDNFWKVIGAGSRWKFFTNKKFSLGLNNSIESWTVGSGGNDSSIQNSENTANPNIFNNSGKRVETQNIIGSISLPLTWNANKEWQFTLNPGISFLPPSQGEGQGGAGEFYGTNPYISGGLLWHPMPHIGITVSATQPFGSGNNSFDRNLKYSKVPILSGGINLHLNPRIALQGQLTNGFGATPATALLALPSDNRLGYKASFVYTADAPDTPQPQLSTLQKSLSLGGLTVNTALVPPDKTSLFRISADHKGNLATSYGSSISNILHLDFYRSMLKNSPQTNIQERTFFANNRTTSLRGSGKIVLTSPLRGEPVWSAIRISFGNSIDELTNNANKYLFAESPFTWEKNSKLAISISPKIAWSEVGGLWGIGIGANIPLFPKWELIAETNIVNNLQEDSNATLGLRWNATNNVTIEAYGTTASSILDMGQLLNAEEVRWGTRVSITF